MIINEDRTMREFNEFPAYDEVHVISDIHMGGKPGFQILRETQRLAGYIGWGAERRCLRYAGRGHRRLCCGVHRRFDGRADHERSLILLHMGCAGRFCGGRTPYACFHYRQP